MQTEFSNFLPAKRKPFKIKPGKYYIDFQRRIYGPMRKHVSLGSTYFTAPGHSFRWDEQGSPIGITWFSRNQNPHTLTQKFNHKKKSNAS